MTETLSNYQLENILPAKAEARSEEDKQHIVNLAASIARIGLRQRPQAQKISGGKIQLFFGDSRLKAYRLLHAYLLGENVSAYSGYTPHFTDEFKRATVNKKAADFEKMPVIVITGTDDREIFEAGVAENFDRKNLTIIETARLMLQYMNLFGATSSEVGRLFGYAGATVRTMIRFPNLSPEAQDALNRGDLSQDSAKKLLSVQDILARDSDYLGAMLSGPNITNPTSASNYISAVIKSKNHVELWGTVNTSFTEPPTGGRGLWEQAREFGRIYSDVKFKDLIKPLLELGIYERMKNEIITDALTHTENFDPDSIENEQWAESVIQDAIMEAVKMSAPELVENFGMCDHSAAVISALMRPPACSICPFRVALDKVHYCMNPGCHQRRLAEFQDFELQRLSETLEIPVYKKTDGDFQKAERGHLQRTFAHWADNKADHLRLIITRPALEKHIITDSVVVAVVSVRDEIQPQPAPAPAPDADPKTEPQNIPESAQDEGEKISAAELAKQRAAEQAAERAKMEKRRAIENDMLDYIGNVAAPFLAQKLTGGTLAFWQNLALWILHSEHDVYAYIDSEDTPEENRLAIIALIMSELVGYDLQRNFAFPQNRAEIVEFINMGILRLWSGCNENELPTIPPEWEKEDQEETEAEQSS